MHWNHRVIRTEQNDEPCYAIHECYYENEGDAVPCMWTESAHAVLSDTRRGLFWVLSVMAKAVGKPVLEERDGKLYETEPAQELSDDLKKAIEAEIKIGS